MFVRATNMSKKNLEGTRRRKSPHYLRSPLVHWLHECSKKREIKRWREKRRGYRREENFPAMQTTTAFLHDLDYLSLGLVRPTHLFIALSISTSTSTERAIVMGLGCPKIEQSIPLNRLSWAKHCDWCVYIWGKQRKEHATLRYVRCGWFFYLFMALSISTKTRTDKAIVMGFGFSKIRQSIPWKLSCSAKHCMWWVYVRSHHVQLLSLYSHYY